jgi:TetR/AcrR family fatty acid metabolism transcriptional regulator
MSTSAARTKATVVADFRRAQILDAARASFAHHGLRGTTMDDIARRARVAKGTIYLYYRSKEQILADALGDGIRALHAETVPPLAAPGPLDAKLRHFFTATLTYFDRRRDFFYLCHSELDPQLREQAGTQLEAVYAAQRGAWASALRDAGVARPKAMAAMIVSLAFGLASQRVRGWCQGPVETDVAAATTLLAKGLAR